MLPVSITFFKKVNLILKTYSLVVCSLLTIKITADFLYFNVEPKLKIMYSP